MDITKQAHQFLRDKGCLSIGQVYTAFQFESMLTEFAQEQVKLFCQHNVGDNHKPTWQEILEYANEFAKKRSINNIDAVRCFEECAKYIAQYPNIKIESNEH